MDKIKCYSGVGVVECRSGGVFRCRGDGMSGGVGWCGGWVMGCRGG